MFNAINKLVAPLRARVANMIARAVVKVVDDSTKMQIVQLSLLEDETREVERVQQYGFTSVPPTDSEAVVLFVGGRRDHGFVVAVDSRANRLRNLESGQVAVYDDTGSKVVLKRNGDIEIVPSSGKVTVTGDVEVSGTVTGTTDVVGGGISLKNHTHTAGSFTNSGGPVTGTSGTPI